MLSALSLLLLALMVALSFNLSHALRGKTRLQQHSDAQAYSMATLEARSLNFFAISNRAIASSYVAMNSVHASMAAASVTAEMYSAAENNFYQIAAMEAALSVNKCKHCPHIVEAVKIGRKFRQASSKQRYRIQQLENTFSKTVKSLDKMMDNLHASQRSVWSETSQVLSTGTAYGLSELQRINAPKASALNPSVGKLNADEFSCAIDGMPCRSPGRPGDTSLEDRAKELTVLSNATRTNWIANRGRPSLPRYLHPEFLRQLTRDIQGEGFTKPQSHIGTAKTVQRRGRAPLHEGPSLRNTGQVISADEHGSLFSQWKHGVGSTSYETRISSDASGGEHVPRKSHSGTHDQFQGTYTVELMSCANKGHCFMKFRSDPSAQRDFGQPPVYSYVTQKLREGDVRKAPWELNEAGRVKFRFGSTEEGTLDLAAGEGAGLSKALVYYHRLGDWQEPPNLFNPFWRAKLHPFTPAEAAKVLEEAGNPDAARLAATSRLPL